MNEILKKIDEEIRKCYEGIHTSKIGGMQIIEYRAKMSEAKLIKEIIQAKQKEKIICKGENLTCKAYNKNTNQCLSVKECDWKMNVLKTKGDAIRESNESLAKFTIETEEDAFNGERWTFIENCLEYFNQPIESEE